MTALARREQNRLTKQKRILDAALIVFSETGYSGASMDAIAVEAGVSKPTLYQYFGAKEQLFSAMLQPQGDDILKTFSEPAESGMVAQLHAFAWKYAEIVLRPDLLSLARLVVGEVQRFPEIGPAYQAAGPDKLLQGMIDFLTKLEQNGRLAFDDAELAAQDLWGLILSAPRNQAMYEPANLPDKKTLARYIDNGLKVFLKAYSTQPQADIATLAELTDGPVGQSSPAR